jgi:hypothetical protein
VEFNVIHFSKMKLSRNSRVNTKWDRVGQGTAGQDTAWPCIKGLDKEVVGDWMELHQRVGQGSSRGLHGGGGGGHRGVGRGHLQDVKIRVGVIATLGKTTRSGVRDLGY